MFPSKAEIRPSISAGVINTGFACASVSVMFSITIPRGVGRIVGVTWGHFTVLLSEELFCENPLKPFNF